MYQGKVVKKFICRFDRKLYNPEATYRHQDVERMEQLAKEGYVKFDGPPAGGDEDPNLSNGGGAAGAAADQDQDSRLKHVGGGYYELPDGTKVRGKEAALEALKALKAAELKG